MKKNGFTLAEALISLAIIGVIAAIAAPMINKFKPDEDKVAFLKTYDSIVEVVKNIADNTRLYPLAAIDSDGNNIDFSEKPLENVVQINDFNGTGSNYPSATGKDKLCEILADAFKAAPATTCATSDLTLGKINFSTKDGVDFYMSTRWPSGTDTYKTTIKFDINGSEGQNCVSGESGCTKPDQFEVLVSSAGRVVASDVMAQKYLQTRGSYRKADYDVSGLTKIAELPAVFAPECINDTVYTDACREVFCENYPNDVNCKVDPCEGYNPATDGYREACSRQYCDYWKVVKGATGLTFSNNYITYCFGKIDKELTEAKKEEGTDNDDDDKKSGGPFMGGDNEFDQGEWIDSIQDKNGLSAAEKGDSQPYYDQDKPSAGGTDELRVK